MKHKQSIDNHEIISTSMKTILDAAVDIKMIPNSYEIAFMARSLVQATLPHSDPGDVPIWGRNNGNLILTIKPDWELDTKTGKPRSVGIPYGTIPRLLLFWITTEAVRTKSRRIELGDSLSAFMRELGLVPTGGRYGSISRLREQMNRLFRSKISFDVRQVSDDKKGQAWVDMQIATKGEFWWNYHQPDQPSLWKSWIELGESFYEAICAAPVPLDLRALKALRKSPMALDLYAWMNYRTFTLKSGKEQFISWHSLSQQLGSDYGNTNDFRRKAKCAIKKILIVSPGINFEFVDGGLTLRKGLLAIKPKVKKSETSTKSSG
jgi:hypothetical protein